MTKVTIYRWAVDRGVTPQVAYGWRRSGLPVEEDGKVHTDKADEWLAHRREALQRRPRHPMERRLDEHLPILQLAAFEEESVVRGLCSLGFLRAQGRTLASQSQHVFADMIWNQVYRTLPSIRGRGEFNALHASWVGQLQRSLATAQGRQLSYGQGQKSLNVALKFIVDWASRPNDRIAQALRPWLHCPLDSVVMQYLRDCYPEVYSVRIGPLYPGISGTQRFSLTKMSRDAYEAWQSWISDLLPSKPVLLDVIWVLERPASTGPDHPGVP